MATEESQRYFADWADAKWEGMQRDFAAEVAPDSEILYAEYTYEDYSGSAWVLYEHDGTLYEVHGSHCSCYGLEDQWTPEETTWEAIAMRPRLPDAVSALLKAHSEAKQ